MKKAPLFALLFFAAACSPSNQGSLAEVDRMLQSGESKEAVAALETLRKGEGPRADIMLRLGSAHERLNEISLAVSAYKEGAEADPRSIELRLALANLYMNLAQYESARDSYLAARACGADDATVSIALGTCLGRIGELPAADEEFRRAGAAGVPSSLVAYNQGIAQFALGNHAEARTFLEKARADQPDLHVATRELAHVLISAPDRDASSLEHAVELAWKAVDAMPEDWRSHDVLGQAYLAQGDWEAAKSAFVEALRLGHNPPVVEDHYVQAEKMRRAALALKKPAGS
ncbi:MAG: tetratricopeptide repeat protein [Planctomycetota bacterium]